MKFLFGLIIPFLFIACVNQEPIKSSSATILIKTPTMKFYDKGFISKFDSFTQVQIYSAGKTVLDLKIYEDKICQSTFECESLDSFNRKYLDKSYASSFLKDLFDNLNKEIVHRDKSKNILIKIRKD